MANINILYVGEPKDDFIRSGINEFEKRIGAFAKVKNICIKPQNPPEDPTDEDTDEDTDAPTEPSEPTEKPTDPAEDPTDEPKPGKKGCGSAIGLSALLTVVGAAWVIRKKRED